MTFRVETTAAAEQEADALLDWLQPEHAGDAGVWWFLALQDAIASLAEFPARCPLAPENLAFPFEVRHLLYMATHRTYIGFSSRLKVKPYMSYTSVTVAVNRSSTNQQFAFIRSQRPIAVGCLGS
jgi:plasmid stabilization system protein ParE